MFLGIAVTAWLTHTAAVIGGGSVGAWVHAKYLVVKAKVQADVQSTETRLKALEAAIKAQAPSSTTPPAA